MVMAPEPEVLKRKRSRPSDWWANGSIIASTPQRIVPPQTQQDESEPGPAKKRGRLSTSSVAESLVRDAPAAGNRGRPAKKRQSGDESNDENRGPDELAGEKPVRRGRSSGNGEELRNVAGAARNEAAAPTAKSRRGRKPAVEQPNDVGVSGEKPEAKRRGRPAAVQAEEVQEEVAKHGREQHAPKRRGRPSMKESGVRASVQDAEEDGADVAEPKKRGRRPAAHKAGQASDEQELGVQVEPKRRGRQPVAAVTGDIAEPLVPAATRKRAGRAHVDDSSQDPRPSMVEEPERGRPRTRRTDVKLQVPEVTASQVSVQEERGRRRTRLSDVQSQEEPPSASMRNQKAKGQKTSQQPESRTTNVETASSKLTKASSRSQKVSRTAGKSVNGKESGPAKQRKQPSSSAAKPQASSQAKKISKWKSNVEPSRKRKEIENPETTPVKRRRLSKVTRQENSEVPEPEPEESSMLYQHLKPVSRKVSRQTIAAKWEPLPLACADKVSKLLQEVQRPVVARLNDERKKTQASTALQMVSRRLVSKISKGLPFPPATRNHREDDFDFEKVLDYNRALEAQLTPALHGNELLEAELEKETARLEADKEILAELEKNAKSEATMRTQAARKLHVLLQPDESQTSVTALKDDIGMEEKSQHLLPLDLSMDENLKGLIKGLHGHVDTINGNMKQVSGISEAIVKSKASIQGTLFDHLSEAQYQEIILGSD